MQIVKRQQRKIEIDLFAAIQVIWKRKWVILLSGLAASLIAYIIALAFITPQYAASATLYANNSNSGNVSTSISSSDMNASARLVDTYAAIMLSDPVLDQVIEEIGIGTTAATLSRYISVAAVNETEVFKITVNATSPKTAAQIANAVADIAPAKISEFVDGCSVKVVSYAKVPSAKVYPNEKRAVNRGFLIGLIVSCLAVCVVAILDTRIKGELDLCEWDFPVLGVIPAFSEAEKVGSYGYGHSNKESKNELIQ